MVDPPSEKRSIGASMKYGWLLNRIDEQQLYTAAAIAKLGFPPKREPKDYNRAKRALWKFAKYHQFHATPDGNLGPYPAWYGWRWKESARPEDLALPAPKLPQGSEKRSAGIILAAAMLLLASISYVFLS